MYRQPKTAGMTALVGLICATVGSSAWASPLAVTNTFQPDTPATAASVNQNFTDVENAVNDNDARITTNTGNIADNFSLINDNAADITTLQSGNRPAARTFIDIDCNADPDTLIKPPYTENFYPYTTFNITGDCNGPLLIKSDGVRLVGTEPNRGASIVLPNPTADPSNGAVFGDGAHDLQLENITVDATQWGSWAVAQGSDAAGVYARNAFVRLIDVDVKGGLWGVNPFRNAIIRMEGTVNITEFVNAGISSGDHSLVGTRGQVNISTTRTDGTNYIVGVEAYRLGIVDFRAGVTIDVPPEDAGNGIFPRALTTTSNSLLRIRNAGTNTINGTAEITSGSTQTLDGVTLTGAVFIIDDGQLTLLNSSHSGGPIIVGGRMRVINSTIATGSLDPIFIEELSAMVLQDSTVENASGAESIFIDAFGMLTFQGDIFGGSTVNLSGRNVLCTTANSFNDPGLGTNIGTITGC